MRHTVNIQIREKIAQRSQIKGHTETRPILTR